MKKTTLFPAIASAAALLTGSVHAAVYTISDFSNATNTTQHFNFDSDWSGTPAIDDIAGESSLYLQFTATWTAAASPGDFVVRYALDDDGGRSRADMLFNDGSIEVLAPNVDGDGDGVGPATARPAFAIDTNAQTTATFVMRVDQTLGSPGGDWNFATIGQQAGANTFLYVNPNLATDETNNSTILAGWRSSQNNFDSVSFITSNLNGNISFSDISLYTGDDTPFAPIPEPSSTALLGLGGLALMLRRRR